MLMVVGVSMGNKNSVALQMKDICFHYEQNENNNILNHLDLSVNKGEFVSIVGASGSGKSTIFRLIAGLEQPQIGSILIDGKKIENRLGKIGYMPQQDH